MTAHMPSIRLGRARAGFTLLELMIATSVFSILGYALMQAVRMADHSHARVIDVATTNRALSKATATLQRELKAAQSTTMVVAAGIDGNQEVTISHPITVGGAAVWGVHDKRLGSTTAEQNQIGWQLRYTVRDVVVGAGQIERQLLRQIRDGAGNVQLERVLLRNLATGTAPPGFTMVQNGDVWEITLTVAGGNIEDGRQSIFQVRPRN